ncbi:MAG: undecaprenyl-diphosphate phosphatase [Rhodospirillaceae bacterium]|nr:MAG: undecaprenyl-diphosphate phosphatase [Rhodospirillaceae bacterium]
MAVSPVLMAAFLGVVEGVTEFLPVSSTGHLILVEDLLGFEGPPGKLFEIVIQLGAILSVCWLYRVKLIGIVRTLFQNAGSRRFTLNIVLAFLPAVVIGALAYRIIKEVLFNPWVVAVALIVGGIAILIIERLPSVTRPRISFNQIEDVPPLRAFGIGLFQCISMIPGTSRSAATIMGALLMGVTRSAAAEFSFILAIPTMLGATVFDIYKNRATLSVDGAQLIAVGFVVAFIVALFVVRWMIGFISKHGFAPFAYYRIAIGALMIVILLNR